MKKRFTITYDIVTDASSRDGDFAYSGYVTRNGETVRKRNYIPKNPHKWTLREAMEFLRGNFTVECDSCPWSPSSPPRWINFSQSYPDYGDTTNFALHPDKHGSITGASMCRIARLFQAYGESK